MTARLDVTPKSAEQNLIVRSDKLITNNERLRSTFCTIKANYWQTRSIARPHCNSRATCNIVSAQCTLESHDEFSHVFLLLYQRMRPCCVKAWAHSVLQCFTRMSGCPSDWTCRRTVKRGTSSSSVSNLRDTIMSVACSYLLRPGDRWQGIDFGPCVCGIVFSSVCLTVFVCVRLFVDAIALERFEMSPWNFYRSKIWSKARRSPKVAAFQCTAARWWRFNIFDVLVAS